LISRPLSHPLWRPIIATFVMVLAVIVANLWGSRSAEQKLSALGLIVPGRTVSVLVDLAFTPETFHMNLLQDIGRVQRVDGHLIYLADADPALLMGLARNFWVVSLRPWQAAPR